MTYSVLIDMTVTRAGGDQSIPGSDLRLELILDPLARRLCDEFEALRPSIAAAENTLYEASLAVEEKGDSDSARMFQKAALEALNALTARGDRLGFAMIGLAKRILKSDKQAA